MDVQTVCFPIASTPIKDRIKCVINQVIDKRDTASVRQMISKSTEAHLNNSNRSK